MRRRELEECWLDEACPAFDCHNGNVVYFWKKSWKNPLHQISASCKLAHNKQRYLSVVDWDQLEGTITEFCCDGLFSLLMVDGTCSVLSMPSIEVKIGAADDRHNKKASKKTMQR